jgi:enolase
LSAISDIKAREVLDSRGNPTVEVDIVLADGSFGRGTVPSGASTGSFEAIEKRDGDRARYRGRGVLQAVGNVTGKIGPRIKGMSAYDQAAIDRAMIELDGTPNKANLGANAMLGVSIAVAHAAAASKKTPLYRYIAQGGEISLPAPMLNVINGGRHAANSTDFQEFMIVPAGFDSFTDAIRAGSEVYHTLAGILHDRGLSTNVGDEGGFAPSLDTNRMAVDLLVEAITKAGYTPGEHLFIALDTASSEIRGRNGRYNLARESREVEAGDLIDLFEDWLRDYPIVSIEDGLAEDDNAGWQEMTRRIGDRVQLVGDDTYTTNPERIRKGIANKESNAVLVKLNQIGTVTETLEAIEMTRGAGWGVVISHRSGETEDTTIADLAVGIAAGQIKSGAPARGERTAKYNRLIRIEDELGKSARYAGAQVYGKYIR